MVAWGELVAIKQQQIHGSCNWSAHVALVCASTNDGRPLTGGTNLIWTVVDWVTSGSGPCMNGTHVFSVVL